jgi:hypothetical protein
MKYVSIGKFRESYFSVLTIRVAVRGPQVGFPRRNLSPCSLSSGLAEYWFYCIVFRFIIPAVDSNSVNFKPVTENLEEPGYCSRYSDWLRAGLPRVRSSSPSIVKTFYSVHTSSTGNPASYPLVTGGSFPRGKASVACNWPLSPPTNAEVKRTWFHTFTLPYVLIA